MRRRKRSTFELFKLCGLCFMTIIIYIIISTICTHQLSVAAEKTILLEDRMEVVRKVLREVPLIDG